MTDTKPFGSWPSPITASMVVESAVRLGEVRVSDSGEGDPALWWSEGRPADGGRTQIVRRSPDGSVADVLPAGWGCRTSMHEYGGGAWWLAGETLFFCKEAGQKVHRIDPGFEPQPVTPTPPLGETWCYADGTMTPDFRWIVCAMERRGSDGETINQLVAIRATGGTPIVLRGGSDFVSSPRIDPTGRYIAWITWDHPDMPWDATRLWVAELDNSSERLALREPVVVAGGPDVSVQQPLWDPTGRLWMISDETDWWTLYAATTPGRPEKFTVRVDRTGDIGSPAWVFAQSRYGFLSDGRVVFAYSSDGVDHLAVLEPLTGEIDHLDVGATAINGIATTATTAVMVSASFTAEAAITAVLVGRGGSSSTTVIRAPRDLPVSSATLSIGRPVSFPTGPNGNRVAHGLVYLPTNPEVSAPAGERPPLIVMIHGGPTAAARPELRLETQYWTSRGFAVVDVNYRGSTGFGRRYRNELRGAWGVADVEDCVAAARSLADAGHVDGDRMVIRGGSAGGFTALAALTFTDTFAAGASLYGVADLELLAADTHKFEARYLDSLVGPLPESVELYRERSPIHHVDQLDRPVIVFQGMNDVVVPPNQSEAIVSALRERGVPVAYLVFENEGHGFRKAETLISVLNSELSFYCQVLGIEHPEGVDRIPVENL